MGFPLPCDVSAFLLAERCTKNILYVNKMHGSLGVIIPPKMNSDDESSVQHFADFGAIPQLCRRGPNFLWQVHYTGTIGLQWQMYISTVGNLAPRLSNVVKS